MSAPDRSAATTPDSDAIERLNSIREWVTTGIAKTLAEDPSGFLLGVESAAIIHLLDLLEGRILNLEAESHV